MTIDDRTIKQELKKALEFYRELGFEYLPVKAEDVLNLLSNTQVSVPSPAEKASAKRVPAQDRPDIKENEKALRLLREEIGDCTRCKLCKGRKNIVFGEGHPDADLMFIGEGPGRDEDIQARPFVGDAGKLLTNLIIKLGMKRQDVYIGNIVKCRPPHNRDPEDDEISTCKPFIEKQIKIIRPRVIVTLGRVASQSLLMTRIPISRLRGNFLQYDEIPVMPTFHPAYLLRNPKDKWNTWDDMQKVLERL